MNELERAFSGIDAWDAAGRGQGKQKIAIWELESSRYNPDLFPGFHVIVPPQWSYKIDRKCKADHLMDTMGTFMSNRPNDEYHILGGSTSEKLQYCIDNEIDIINVSLDAGYDNPENNAQEAAFLASGGIIVCAAGNDGSDGLSGLSRKPTTISVGAVRFTGGEIVRQHFSSYDQSGEYLDCMGFDCVQPVHRTDKLTGTSFACPWVGSILAYWRTDFIEREGCRPSYYETIDFIKKSNDIEVPGYDVYTGWGILTLWGAEDMLTKKRLCIQAGTTAAMFDGKPYELKAMPLLVNGRFYLGARDIADLTGAAVVSTDNVADIAVFDLWVNERKEG